MRVKRALSIYPSTEIGQRVEIWKERAGSFGTVTEKNGRPMPGHTGHNWDKEAVV